MSQDPSGGAGCILDSTGNNKVLTPYNMDATNLTNTPLGKGLTFDGTNETLISVDSFSVSTPFTMESVVYFDQLNQGSGDYDYILQLTGGSMARTAGGADTDKVYYYDGGGSYRSPDTLTGQTWTYVSCRGTNVSPYVHFYIDDTVAGDVTTNPGSARSLSGQLTVGSYSSSHYLDGTMTEARLSDVARTEGWVKTTYYSNWDQLIVYEDESQVTNWLGDWAKRIKFTADSSKVDSTLHDFPMLVTLASGTGITNEDVTDVFTELNTPLGESFTDFVVSQSVGDGGSLDSGEVYRGSVVKDGSTYKMWYGGHNGSTWRINYCTSTDGNNWTGHQLVVANGSEGTWDSNYAYNPCVIKISDTSYKMWYSGHNGSVWSILYCDSTDGINWSNFQRVVAVGDEGTYDTNVVWGVTVVRESATSYKMWYGGNDSTNYRTIYCTSTNGTTWTGHQLAIDIGSEGTYDTTETTPGTVIKDASGTFHMWYTGKASTSDQVILKATSSNGISWSDFKVVVPNGSQGTYDTQRAQQPGAVILDGDYYNMWYVAYTGTGHYKIINCQSDDCEDRKKIAITTEDGTTQCPVEIEKFDLLNDQAWLWFKAPVVFSDRNTDFYLYYDKGQPDNSNIGEPGDSISATVWSNSFSAVWHLGELDAVNSISSLDGTAYNMETTDVVPALVADGVEFGGTNEYVGVVGSASDTSVEMGDHDKFTMSFVFKTDGSLLQNGVVSKSEASSGFGAYTGYGKIRFSMWAGSWSAYTATSSSDIYGDDDYHVAFVVVDRVADTVKIFVDGSEVTYTEDSRNGSWSTSTDITSAANFNMGWMSGMVTEYYEGGLDELRLAIADRSDAWIKVDSNSISDSLLTFNAPTTRSIFLFNGTVKVGDTPVARTVNLHRRATGELVGTTVSNAQTGYFEIGSPYNELHYVVILPDEFDDYNLIAHDKIDPGV
jgi:hypothetical protein